ncbi:pyruvate phosphate dikinase-like enzyme [Winogradskyella eximia]|uniref:Phosphoenolpyruvate synthase n=1 Tax=Winogradskyella eximia TaxID=262006 RepID=A0A3D9H1Q9_9FLAO|nr:PEP/pyruvate-binding domain-containing protein [Winogradskyella eximia]RED43428.1 pyruvate phosphate dikinase-like enzyme [Winogradskyella eximia]
MNKYIVLSFFLLGFSTFVCSQSVSNDQIKDLITTYKNDVRGPYKDIRWFCTDGSLRQPKDPCPENIGPGVQHARYKDAVVNLGKTNHIYLGQILAYTDAAEFWDVKHNHSRLKQYQLDKYLRTIDNGWVNQKGQFYRGSIQSEDEEAWGIEFYKWLLADDTHIKQNYFLIRQSLKDIPHSGDDNVAQLMRSQSKVISDVIPEFMDLRVKIHSLPEASDIQKVKNFKQTNTSKISTVNGKKIDELIATMTLFFKPVDVSTLVKQTTALKNTEIGSKINGFISSNSDTSEPSKLIEESSQLLYDIREAVITETSGAKRLQLLDVSLKLEEIVFKTAQDWETGTVGELLNKICYLGLATAGAGYVELSEWQELDLGVKPSENKTMTLDELTQVLENARRQVEWSSSMVKANYQHVVDQYTAFEPLAYGFIDDKIRGSVALHLGKAVSDLGDFIAKESSLTNKVLDVPNQSGFRGLNPGYALGELVVVSGSPEDIEVSSNKIYIFQRSPSDLKPIAGIATVSEGNMVSHVQLLARNLGIPNAALSDDNLQSLLKYNGETVFYAVSNKGNIIMKLEKDMTESERALFLKKERKEGKIAVPIEKIRLDETHILNLRSVDASNSGQLCGPKAANLGQLKKMFPDKVVEGLVIPFGIFKSHMDQQMPDQNKTYWEFLNAMFAKAEQMSQDNSDAEIEAYQLSQLEILRVAIKKMPMKPEFLSELEKDFKSILGNEMGDVPVFLRSDTNMEDLKEFTGAGLNLTLFNVADKNKIIEGIKDVWASPYTERSFKWRQKYLLNPENVFPSILVIPSVDVDYSGVLITKGISNSNDNDLTVAFSRGAGGAVDGQSAETYLIKNEGGFQLLAPARESYFNRLPITGGMEKQTSTFDDFVLNIQNINEIRDLAKTIRIAIPKETNSDYEGAYDVELGFKDNKLWLFQIRPFVENKNALSSEYLESITPKINKSKVILLSKNIN